MAKQRFTAEEELLNLIDKEDPNVPVKLRRKKSLFSNLSWRKNFRLSLGSRIFHSLVRAKNGVREPNLKVLNKIFFIISAVLLIYLIIDFSFNHPDAAMIGRLISPPKPRSFLYKNAFQPRPFLYYLEMVRRRNIFSPIVLGKSKKPKVAKEQLRAMIKNLRLVGISWSKNPVAMIEDEKTKKTYFLKKGQMINEFKIEDVLKNEVILSFKGEKIELI